MARLTLNLHVTIRDALAKSARREERTVDEQAAWIFRQWFEASGDLPASIPNVSPHTTAAQPHPQAVPSGNR